jgi:lysozyme family protein
VLEMEGGYTDDAYDPGGPTNQGITLAVYAEWKGKALDADTAPSLLAQLKQIAPADVAAIYKERYWRKADCERLRPGLAVMHFDAAVNQGPGTAVRILQEAVGTSSDGEIGPLTLRAIAATPPIKLLNAYANIRRERYRAMPHFWRFGRGWLGRVDNTLALASKRRENGGAVP